MMTFRNIIAVIDAIVIYNKFKYITGKIIK